MEKLNKRYGLLTAICMVVGIVIGSGVFFKTQDVLAETNGDAASGVIAWLIGGAIMVIIASTFAIMATKYEKVGGLVDYAEATCGKTYAYFIGWFTSIIYLPAMTGVLAWVSARYTMVAVFGYSSVSPEALFGSECIVIAVFYLVLIYFMNAISPKIAGKFQVSSTVIKLIPIALIALIGTVIGLVNGNLGANFTSGLGNTLAEVSGEGGGFVAALCCTAFAYEGWIIATTINAEIKDAKRNLPIALSVGAGIVVLAYVLYYLGMLGLESSDVLINQGTEAAFLSFGKVIAGIINFLIIISCLGTLNGLSLGCSRAGYALAARGEGISPKTFSQVDEATNIPNNSASLGLLLSTVWFVYFIASQFLGWFGSYGFDSSELPIITIYAMYIPILIAFMIKEKDTHPVKRFVLPALSIVGCIVMMIASVLRHGMGNVYYLIVFALIMLLGFIPLYLKKKNGTCEQTDEQSTDVEAEA